MFELVKWIWFRATGTTMGQSDVAALRVGCECGGCQRFRAALKAHPVVMP